MELLSLNEEALITSPHSHTCTGSHNNWNFNKCLTASRYKLFLTCSQIIIYFVLQTCPSLPPTVFSLFVNSQALVDPFCRFETSRPDILLILTELVWKIKRYTKRGAPRNESSQSYMTFSKWAWFILNFPRVISVFILYFIIIVIIKRRDAYKTKNKKSFTVITNTRLKVLLNEIYFDFFLFC